MIEFGVADVFARVSDAAFGKPLITNVLRGQVVETIVNFALEPHWRWCAADYSSWDFDHSNGLRLEVKQSSWLQTWETPKHGRVYPGFDIRSRSGRWEGPVFVEEFGRAANLYVFAYHDIRDHTADHRDPTQWEFYVVATRHLPETKRISLSALKRLATGVPVNDLLEEVSKVSAHILTLDDG